MPFQINGLLAFNKGYWFDPKIKTYQIFCKIIDQGWFAFWIIRVALMGVPLFQGTKTHSLIITVEDNRRKYTQRNLRGFNTVILKEERYKLMFPHESIGSKID